MNRIIFGAATAALLALPFQISAQEAATKEAPTKDAAQKIIVTGNPLRLDDAAAPTSVLSGEQLAMRRGASLGDTLGELPGVAATYFGPNANRPVIRGQDGERVRVLANSGASMDVSTLSFDHAVPMDPLAVERLEVLRGPAALLYGGAAVGGVVNVIDNRIPKSVLLGLSGAVQAREGGAAREQAASALLEGGGNGLAWHVDSFWRKSADLSVPTFEVTNGQGAVERRRRVLNSASQTQGGALGASRVWQGGYWGANLESYASQYGSVAEEDITLRMRRERLALAGEWATNGLFSTVRAQAASTRYAHEEVQATGAVGTRFTNRGQDARLELIHRPWATGLGVLSGVWGAQAESARFSALGEEAFVPTTATRQAALFALEQWAITPAMQLSLGIRAEQVRVRSEGDAAGSELHFGPALERRFAPRSVSVGATWKTGAANLPWQWHFNLADTQRAPASHELFANGLHTATGAFERGDAQQALERGRHVELGLSAQWHALHFKANVFRARFRNYIVLMNSDSETLADAGGANVPHYDYRGLPAQLQGWELEGTWRLPLQGLGASGHELELQMQTDSVRGELSAGLGAGSAALPRLAPQRASAALQWRKGAWQARVQVQHAAAQTRVPSNDRPTPGWTQWHLQASQSLHWAGGTSDKDLLLFAKLQNATNQLAYNATTLATVRARSPLPGRGLTLGLQLNY